MRFGGGAVDALRSGRSRLHERFEHPLPSAIFQPSVETIVDDRDMADITSPAYPGEGLVVCKNPLLADERKRKRNDLLAATEADLAKLQARV
jgi:hypothetical protein